MAAVFGLVCGALWTGANLSKFAVIGESMDPTLRNESFAFGWKASDATRGDIVAFKAPQGWTNGDTDVLIKRVIAVGGDQISGDASGNLFVNGEKVDEPYVKHRELISTPFSMTVKGGCLWVRGDNRSGSDDSLFFSDLNGGCVPVESLTSVLFKS